MKAAVLALAASLAANLIAIPGAHAAAVTRVWVSGHGVDQAGCGAPTAPCRSLIYAESVVAAGGEIDILDPAGYGAIDIIKALSIVNDGVGTAGVQSTSGDAITIDAGPSDNVYLRGLTVDGVGQSGAYGIDLLAGARLTVVNCVIRNFSQDGIGLFPPSGTVNVLVADTILSDNAGSGLYYEGGGGSANIDLVAERLIVQNNDNGIGFDAYQSTGSTRLSVADSLVDNNSSMGIAILSTSANAVANIDNDQVTSSGYGLYAIGPVIVHLTRSSIFQNNSYGIVNDVTGPGAIYSTFDNRVDANTLADVDGAALLRDTLK